MKKVVALVSALFALLLVSASAAQAQSVTEIARTTPGFSILSLALDLTGLDAVLDSDDVNVTVFAPTDEAFLDLPLPVLAYLFLFDRDLLADVLLYHVVGGEFFADDILALPNNTRVETLLGQRVTVRNRGKLRVNSSKVIATDVDADNGVVHVIDRVLVPNLFN